MNIRRIGHRQPASRWLLLCVLGLAWGVPIGCSRVNYPEPKVQSPLGRSAVCAACKKKIESVGDENLMVAEAVQYIVCDEKCAARVKKQLEREKSR